MSEGIVSGDSALENALLRRLIHVTSSDLDLREVTQRVAALVTEATGTDVCFVHLVDEDGSTVSLAGATPPFDELVGSVVLPMGEGVAGWVAQHAEPAVVPDKWKDPRYKYIPALRGEDYRSLVSVPMLVRGRVVGVLNVHSTQERDWTDADVQLLSGVSDLMARTVENARLYQDLESFAARTVEAQEAERRRLAGDIHDGISQPLVSLWYHLQAAEDAVGDPQRLGAELLTAKTLATEALDEARVAIGALRPSVLDDLGLGPSLESLARTLSDTEVQIDIDDSLRLAPHVEVAVYRIAQEAIHNIARHADATQVAVRYGRVDNGVRLRVIDDGKGLPEDWLAVAEDRGSYGLVGMRERAELIQAHFDVSSVPERGTVVEVVVPPSAVVSGS